MVNTFRLRAKRTTGSEPPASLLFGELAYSDANQILYVGRADSENPPAKFDGNPTDYSEAIASITTDLATLDTSQTAQDNAIADLTNDLATLDTSQTDQDSAIADLTSDLATLDTSQSAQDSAIADLTNDLATLDTSQAAQGQAIALLSAASDSQGDAIGVLATTTGNQAAAIEAITTDQDSQDDAIAALAAVNSQQADAITALLARPAGHGFTYDQQSEPVGPVAGATWRERSAGGLILGEWEWLGSVWASLSRTTLSGAVVNGAATTFPTIPCEAPRCLFVQCRIAVTQQGNPAAPFNSTNYRELFLSRSLTAAANAVFTFRPLISLAQGTYVSPMNYLNPSGAFFFTGTTIVGTPGTMHAPSVSYVYREVRA